jgi:hypothetical protein
VAGRVHAYAACLGLRLRPPHNRKTIGPGWAATASRTAPVSCSHPWPAWLPALPRRTVSTAFSNSTPCRAQPTSLPSRGRIFGVLASIVSTASWEPRAITAETELLAASQPPNARRALTRPWTNWRAAVTDWTINLEAANRARQILERRYLDGHDVLFPDLAREQQALTEATERLAGVGGSVVVRRQGGSRNARVTSLASGRTAVNGGADAVAAGFIDGARAAALDLLGDADGRFGSVAARRGPAGAC